LKVKQLKLIIHGFLTTFHFTQNELEEESISGYLLGERMASTEKQIPMEIDEDLAYSRMQVRKLRGAVGGKIKRLLVHLNRVSFYNDR
jgi:hypothetical protein